MVIDPTFTMPPVTLIVPQIKDEMMAPVEKIWQGNVGSLTVRLVGGDHRSMIQGEPALEVAEILSAVIAGAKAEPAAS